MKILSRITALENRMKGREKYSPFVSLLQQKENGWELTCSLLNPLTGKEKESITIHATQEAAKAHFHEVMAAFPNAHLIIIDI